MIVLQILFIYCIIAWLLGASLVLWKFDMIREQYYRTAPLQFQTRAAFELTIVVFLITAPLTLPLAVKVELE